MNRHYIPRTLFGFFALFLVILFGFIHSDTLGKFFYNGFYPIVSPFLKASSDREASSFSPRDAELLVELKHKAELYDELSKVVVVGTTSPDLIDSRVAAIVARPRMSPYGTVIIGAGARDGIEEGDVVRLSPEVAYGRVGKVYPTSALVVPFSRAGEMTEALLRGRIRMDVEGRGGGAYGFRLPKGISVAPGDLIYLASGLLIAEVKYVSEPEESSFVEVLAQNPLSISEYRFLHVGSEPFESIE